MIDFEIMDIIEQDVFTIFVNIMIEKNWRSIFMEGFPGLTRAIKKLEEKMQAEIRPLYEHFFNEGVCVALKLGRLPDVLHQLLHDPDDVWSGYRVCQGGARPLPVRGRGNNSQVSAGDAEVPRGQADKAEVRSKGCVYLAIIRVLQGGTDSAVHEHVANPQEQAR